MAALNRSLVSAADVLLAPLAYLPPLAGLALVSFVTAAAMLLVIKRTSNQRRLAQVKRAIEARIFELRLFADDVPAILRTEREMVRHSLTYLRLSLVPALWLVVPLTLVIVQLDSFFGYTGLAAGTPSLLTASFGGGARGSAAEDHGSAAGTPPVAVGLEAPSSIRVDTPAVWFPGAREAVWSITPLAPGAHVVRVRLGNEAFEKTAEVSGAVGRRSPVRLAGGLLDQLVNPSEATLPARHGLTAIAVAYPERAIRVLGWDAGWLTVYLVLTFAFMLLLKRPLGVVL